MVGTSQAEAADLASTLRAAVVSASEVAQLRKAVAAATGGDQRKALTAAARAAGLQKVVVGLQPASPEYGPDKAIVLTLAIGAESPAPVFADLGGLSPDERGLIRRVTGGSAAEQLFGWEDHRRAEPDRGVRIPLISAKPFSLENAARMRALIQELRDDHERVGGLAARARAVGYYREAMAMADLGGIPTYLLYLELADADMHRKLFAYPESDFTRWWGPRFAPLINAPGGQPPDPNRLRAEVLLDWEDVREGG